ncbi:MAG: ATP-dependent DNA helicase RecG [Lysobacteraceae bacterium]
MSAAEDIAGQTLDGFKGVGPKLRETLAKGGYRTLQDLWFHLPLRYEDRTRTTAIAELVAGQPALVEGVVEAVERGFRFRPMLKVALRDTAGDLLTLRFIHFRANQAAQFGVGRRLSAYGAPREAGFGMEIIHPAYRFLDADDQAVRSDRLDPVYPAIEGIGGVALARLIGQALERLDAAEAALELLPDWLLAGQSLPSLADALRYVHRPPANADLALLSAGQHPAQKRLALEELLAHHLSLRRQRIAIQALSAPALDGPGDLARRLRQRLPFALTDAQARVLEEIGRDLRRDSPMLRLVQGDVGAGKTVVAALAAAQAIEAGHQVALMAPTELLAEQHHATLSQWFAPLDIDTAWLTGKVTGKTRQQTLARIAGGDSPLVVGTHALMQEGVSFAALALCIIDEQHRFGVHQRLALRDKGQHGRHAPHQLVMTATPIPRTLAMTAYADLDVSVIDALPPGRTPVRTVAISAGRREEVIERIRVACGEGRQAYWVCTLIEESEETAAGARSAAQAAQTTFEHLRERLPELRIGLAHGRLKGKEKQATMATFKAGELDLLVATTVIEVGVDVPNASLMVIENAERLGLSQLHQLRGRVGRGAQSASCALLYQPPLSMLARQRLDILRQTTDGFVIAEKDLELRGPGELLGTRQTGLAQFRIADLGRDATLLPLLREAGERLQRESPATVDALIRRWIGAATRYAEV